jgi:hypothetical protein
MSRLTNWLTNCCLVSHQNTTARLPGFFEGVRIHPCRKNRTSTRLQPLREDLAPQTRLYQHMALQPAAKATSCIRARLQSCRKRLKCAGL